MPISVQTRSIRWLAAGWLVMLLLVSFLPADAKHMLHTRGRLHDLGHLAVFGIFAWLLARSARSPGQATGFLFLTAGLGVAVEIGQDLVFMRPQGSWAPVEWHDVLLDVMAVVLAGVIYFAGRPSRVQDTRQTRPVSLDRRNISPRNDRETAA